MAFSFFKKKRTKEDEYHLEISQSIKRSLVSMEYLYEETLKTPINKKVKSLCQTTRLILKEFANNQRHIYNLSLFADYFLPETNAIIERHVKITTNRIDNEEARQLLVQIEQCIEYADDAFKNILQSLVVGNNDRAEIDILMYMEELKNRFGTLEN